MQKFIKVVAVFVLGAGSLVTIVGCFRFLNAVVVGYGDEQIVDMISAGSLAGAGLIAVLFSGTAWIVADVAVKIDTWLSSLGELQAGPASELETLHEVRTRRAA